jgi:hypothetical protein
MGTGKWYYEVVLLSDGLMQIGWIDSAFESDAMQGQGVGDHANSWAFDGTTPLFSNPVIYIYIS